MTLDEEILRRVAAVEFETAQLRALLWQRGIAMPVTQTTVVSRLPMHGPGSPCCDAYGADRVATHDGSAPEAPTALPFCAEEE